MFLLMPLIYNKYHVYTLSGLYLQQNLSLRSYFWHNCIMVGGVGSKIYAIWTQVVDQVFKEVPKEL